MNIDPDRGAALIAALDAITEADLDELRAEAAECGDEDGAAIIQAGLDGDPYAWGWAAAIIVERRAEAAELTDSALI